MTVTLLWGLPSLPPTGLPAELVHERCSLSGALKVGVCVVQKWFTKLSLFLSQLTGRRIQLLMGVLAKTAPLTRYN